MEDLDEPTVTLFFVVLGASRYSTIPRKGYR